MLKKIFVLFFFILSFETAFSTEFMVCTKCDPAPNNGIKSFEQLRAGDIVTEIFGLKPANDVAFFEQFGRRAGKMKLFTCKVLRKGRESTVYYSTEDYTDWSFIDDCLTTVLSKDISSDLDDLFYFLEQVYIMSEKTNGPDYQQFKDELLADFSGKDRFNLSKVYLKLASFLARFEDSHLRIDYGNLMTELMKDWYLRGRGTFPLDIQAYRGKFYLQLPSGTRKTVVQLLSINDCPIERIITKIRNKISGDSMAHKDSFIVDNFPILYSWIFGYTPEYTIGYKESRKTGQTVVPAAIPGHLLREPSLIGFWSIKRNVGVLTINGFNDDESFESLVVNSFADAQKNQLPAIVIDIRDNRGGSSQALTFLMLFIEDRPFTIYERYQYRQPKEHKDNENKRTWYGKGIGEKVFTLDMYTKSGAEVYRGPIYLLTSARNYSTALDCIIALKNRGNATTIGQQCGGNLISTGNTMTWVGAKTGVRVLIPVSLYYPLNYQKYDDNNALLPDVLMENTPFTTRDQILDKALKMANDIP